MMRRLLFLALAGLPFGQTGAQAPEAEDMMEHLHMEHMHHTMDMEGMVMHENKDQLPGGCTSISEEVKFTVRAGRRYARRGQAFGFTPHEWQVSPCARVTVTLINEDQVRHQWMVHGLPKYIYPQGMFHIEANGGYSKTGTFIVPNGQKTYLVHCDLAQHMEKGMKGQLKVGGGDGDLPSIPGITGPRYPDAYPEEWSAAALFPALIAGGAGIALAFIGLSRAVKTFRKPPAG